MKLALIQEELELYKSKIKASLVDDQNFKWAILQNFEQHWNVEQVDIKEMFLTCLSSNESRNLWGGEKDSPKSVMIAMMELFPDFTRSMFRDLLDEGKDLLLRMNRFGLHCKELLPEVEKNYGKQIDHFHDDPKILSLYLSMVYPTEYCIFDYPSFSIFADKIGIQNIPQEFELLRFFKIMRSLNVIISKDEELKALQEKRLANGRFSKSKNLLLCHDFYFTCGSPEYKF